MRFIPYPPGANFLSVYHILVHCATGAANLSLQTIFLPFGERQARINW
jgi:hypothetical protein